MESLDLQNEVVLKFYAGHQNIQNPVDWEKFPSIKIKILFWFSLPVLIIVFNQEYYIGQSKHTSQLSDTLPLQYCEQENHPALQKLKNWPMKYSAKYYTTYPLE